MLHLTDKAPHHGKDAALEVVLRLGHNHPFISTPKCPSKPLLPDQPVTPVADGLQEGVVRVRRPDAEELGAIRDGAWSFEQVEAYAEKASGRLEALAKQTTLPRSSDPDFWNRLCTKLLGQELFGVNGAL